jgi:hypothetical protein
MWMVFRDRREFHLYRTNVRAILNFLRSDFLYVTVTQNDDGIEGSNEFLDLPSNLFVLSQGGKGHIPLPLWRCQKNASNDLMRGKYVFDALFMGTPGTHTVRPRMIRIMHKVFPNSSFFSYPVRNWAEQYQKSKIILCPRGWGRNSFRLTEVLQMGMIPFYVYNDLIWLPYYDSIEWASFAYIAHIDEFEAVLEHTKWDLTPDKTVSMRHKIKLLYPTHWSIAGVIEQILKLLNFGFDNSDLRCARYSRLQDELKGR